MPLLTCGWSLENLEFLFELGAIADKLDDDAVRVGFMGDDAGDGTDASHLQGMMTPGWGERGSRDRSGAGTCARWPGNRPPNSPGAAKGWLRVRLGMGRGVLWPGSGDCWTSQGGDGIRRGIGLLFHLEMR